MKKAVGPPVAHRRPTLWRTRKVEPIGCRTKQRYEVRRRICSNRNTIERILAVLFNNGHADFRRPQPTSVPTSDLAKPCKRVGHSARLFFIFLFIFFTVYFSHLVGYDFKRTLFVPVRLVPL